MRGLRIISRYDRSFSRAKSLKSFCESRPGQDVHITTSWSWPVIRPQHCKIFATLLAIFGLHLVHKLEERNILARIKWTVAQIRKKHTRFVLRLFSPWCFNKVGNLETREIPFFSFSLSREFSATVRVKMNDERNTDERVINTRLT